MPEDIQTQNPPQDEDLLEKLLAGAAQREAAKQMKELEQKGVVTKAELSTILKENNTQLIETLTSAMAEQMKKAAPPTPAEPNEPPENASGEGQPVQKGQRKGTIQGAADPRADNPIRYLIQKSRAGTEFDDIDKALIWGLTEQGFKQGMVYDDRGQYEFGDDTASL